MEKVKVALNNSKINKIVIICPKFVIMIHINSNTEYEYEYKEFRIYTVPPFAFVCKTGSHVKTYVASSWLLVLTS